MSTKAGHENDLIYYWGEFECPMSSSGKMYHLDIEIEGYDNEPHFKNRNHIGDQICSDPSIVAFARGGSYPAFDLVQYTPGTDRNHFITIGSSLLSLREAAIKKKVSRLKQLAEFAHEPSSRISMKEVLIKLKRNR